MKASFGFTILFLVLSTGACKKNSGSATPPPTTVPPSSFSLNTLKVNGTYKGFSYSNVNPTPIIQLSFLAPLDHNSVNTAVILKASTGAGVNISTSYANSDSTLIIQPSTPLQPITKYTLNVSTALQSQSKGSLQTAVTVTLLTSIDSTDKFPRISDDALLDKVQAQTLRYFWDFGHPVSGLARERTSSGDVVTSGGSGFGVMALLVAAQRGFLTRSQALNRIDTIVDFLTNKATRYHGAFSHWINGSTGATVPFGTQDNGGDIVETSYMIQGLLCARQYFNNADPREVSLRDKINNIWNNVDWTWYRREGRNILYWNWSPDYAWAINVPVKGWNEALITYVLAASSTNYAIPKSTYDSGWAGNGSMRNGNVYYNTPLPLGPAIGGPLFFAHYSFLGIDPHGLSDAYANYWTQDTAHTRINYKYCVANPQGFYGYSSQCWGLTASDDNASGYSAHSPTNDLGIISPTAAVSSLPYTPTESMNAIRFFYYTLGDKAWGQYGFTDAFSLANPWFDTDCVAIDQGPEIVMIENYRSGLLWNLFMSCPEVQSGMKKLGFQSPHF